MLEGAYQLRKQFFRWYIIPSCEGIEVVPFPNRYLSFWFEKNAKVVLSAMNAAFKDGYRYSNIFKG